MCLRIFTSKTFYPVNPTSAQPCGVVSARRVIGFRAGMRCQSAVREALEFEVVFHTVDTSQQQVIYEDRSLTIETYFK